MKLIKVADLNIKGNESVRRVYAPYGLAPTLTTMGGGNREPKIMEKVKILQRPHGYNKGAELEECPTITAGTWRFNNVLKEPTASGLYTEDSPNFHKPPLPGKPRTLKATTHDASVQLQVTSPVGGGYKFTRATYKTA